MALNFQIEIAEGLFVPEGRLFGFIDPSGTESVAAPHRKCRPKERPARLLYSEKFLIHARFVVKTFQVGAGNQLNQVLVAGLVFRQQNQVVVVLSPGVRLVRLFWCDIDFTADDRLDAGFFGCLVELDDAVHHAVVGNRQAVHAQFFGSGDELVEYGTCRRAGCIRYEHGDG